MSIWYMVCSSDGCWDGFPDCNDHYSCDCERSFCSESCADAGQKDDEDRTNTCKYCRLEVAENDELLKYLLESFGITREFIENEYLNKKKDADRSKES